MLTGITEQNPNPRGSGDLQTDSASLGSVLHGNVRDPLLVSQYFLFSCIAPIIAGGHLISAQVKESSFG